MRFNKTKYTRVMLVLLSALTAFFMCQPALATENTSNSATGQLFNVTAIGNNLTIKSTKPGWFYQFAGIKSLTQGFSISNCASTGNNGFCLFSVSDSLPATPVIAGPAVQPVFKICLNGIGDTYGCERVQMGDRFAYITNENGTISLCPISSDGALGTCTTVGPETIFNTPLTNNYTSIALNAAGTLAYVTRTTPSGITSSGGVVVCPINSNATLGACVPSTGTFSRPSGIALNAANTFAYVTNSDVPPPTLDLVGGAPSSLSGTVLLCPIQSDGSLGSCTDSGQGAAFSGPSGIALNPRGTFAYVTNASFSTGFVAASSNTISWCPINADGTLGTCNASNPGETFNQPYGIALNAAGTLAYVTNLGGNTISLCTIKPNGSLGTCTDSGQGAVFNQPLGIALNKGGTIAYVTHVASINIVGGVNRISSCPINPDGSLGSCTLYSQAEPAISSAGIALF